MATVPTVTVNPADGSQPPAPSSTPAPTVSVTLSADEQKLIKKLRDTQATDASTKQGPPCFCNWSTNGHYHVAEGIVYA